MQFGHFDDKSREYVINTPHTPRPWINYLGNESFFGLISNTGGGYCFYRDAKLMRLLRYRYNNVPEDVGGRFYYIKEAGCAGWSPALHPCDTPLAAYECRHGLGYTTITGERDDLRAKLTCLVPMGENCEVHRLELTNLSNSPRQLSLYGAMEWCLWNAVDDSTNFQRNLNIGEVEVEDGVVYHKTEYRERRNHYAYYGANVPIAGFDTDRDSFLGGGGWANPAMVEQGSSGQSIAHGGAPIAALKITAELAAHETKTFVFVLGLGENPHDQKFIAPGVIRKDDCMRVMQKFSDANAVKLALCELDGYWSGLLSRCSVATPDPCVNRMVNLWNQYQCMVTFNMSRSASYYESGTGRGMGFRDSCQDLLGFVHMVPERARQRILHIASIQFADGSTYHQYQPLTRRGNADVGSGFNDDPLWLVACTAAYLRETGDWSILDEPTTFNNELGSEMPLMEHLRRSVRYTAEHLGPHGLPLIGRADWNDCLNLNCFSQEPGESFQTCSNFESGIAESIFIGAMFVKYGGEYAELCRRLKLEDEAVEVCAHVDEMERAMETHGWDGEWFLRAYDAFGGKVGSHECTEGQIYIEPQGFCVMAGIGTTDGKAVQALDSTRRLLLGDYGVELLTPCYSEYHKELGEISTYPPGYKENGSIFCHNNPWVSIAETVLGRGDNAFDIYRRTCPAFLEDKSGLRKAEPYVYAQTVAARASHSEGEARNSWLTGTAAWAFINISQFILGIKPTLDGLSVDPCLPKDFGGYTAERQYRGASYYITVAQTGTYSMKCDGETVQGRCIPMKQGKQTYVVEVTV